MTAGELVAALQIAREVEQARRGSADEALPVSAKPEAEPAPPEAPEENVTSLSSARHTK
jgi:hypothetical protein